MTDLTEEAQAAVCAGKDAFHSPAAAHLVAANHRRRGKKVEVYRCPACGQWHIGRRDKLRRA